MALASPKVAACRCNHFKIGELKRQFNSAESRRFHFFIEVSISAQVDRKRSNVSSDVNGNGDLVRDLPALPGIRGEQSGAGGKPMPMSVEGTIGINPSGLRSPHRSIVEISRPDIARRRLTNWGAIQADTVKVTRRGTFEYSFQARRHLLIAH